jgi:poly(3-hydroxybutyrate) depolymerase
MGFVGWSQSCNISDITSGLSFEKERMMHRYAWILCATTFLLAGCPVPQDQNTIERERYEVNPATGTPYWLFIPHGYRHDRAAPLVVTCHGSPPYDLADMHIREVKKLCEKNGWIAIAPELVATDGILGDGPVVGMIADERRILSIISEVGYRYNIDRANIMITGFSGGGFPMYWVGLRNPDVFSVIAARSCDFSEGNLDGWYPPEAKDVRMLIYYGENDPGAIVIQSRAAIDYFRSKGFSVETVVIPGIGHERRPEVAENFFLQNMRAPRASLPQPSLTAGR